MKLVSLAKRFSTFRHEFAYLYHVAKSYKELRKIPYNRHGLWSLAVYQLQYSNDKLTVVVTLRSWRFERYHYAGTESSRLCSDARQTRERNSAGNFHHFNLRLVFHIPVDASHQCLKKKKKNKVFIESDQLPPGFLFPEKKKKQELFPFPQRPFNDSKVV